MAPVTNFRTWPDMVQRGWGTMRRTGTRWEFVPRLDEMVTVPKITGKVNRRVAPLVVHLVGWLEQHRGRPLDAAGNWGLSVRPIRGREDEAYAGTVDAWSIHSCGGAADFEAPRNPLGAPGPGDFPDGWHEECHRWGFVWGAGAPHGDYVSRPDRMHIEFIGTPAQADEYVAQLAAAGGGITPAPPASGKDDPVAPIPITPTADGAFRAALMVETDAGLVVAQAWITYGSTWGTTEFLVTALDGAGRVLAQSKRETVANNATRVFDVPKGTVLATVEGRAAGSVPAAALVSKPK